MFYTISLFMTICALFLCLRFSTRIEKIMQITWPAFHVHPMSLLDIFRLVSLRYSVLEPRSVRWAVSKIENQTDRSHKTTSREDIDKVTSFRCNRFLSRARIAGLVRNATGTRICAKTRQRPLKGAPLR